MEPFESAILPVLPLKDTVVFPTAITPLFVIRPSSLAAVEAALKADKRIFLTCQKEIDVENPEASDLYQAGTVAEILQVLRVPDGSAKILAEGIYPARAVEYLPGEQFMQALLVRMDIRSMEERATEAYMHTTLKLFEHYATYSDKVPEELYHSIQNLKDPLAFVHAVANYAAIKLHDKQHILDAPSIEEKFLLLNASLEKENQILDLEDQIASQVKNQIGRSQRELFLNEQLKAIERELGIGAGDREDGDDLRADIQNAGLPEEAQTRAEKELTRLSRMAPMSPEATVSRTWLEWIVELPWVTASQDRIDLSHARTILDKDHHGLEKVKARILEHLAVTKLSGENRGPILCLVGPPGVGKTSLARSIASCIGREFVRLSLGGVRDEAEIRGHRRTYVGAMPGKIIQSMKRAGTINPVFLLDEIDKMSSDFRGDPAAALLEVLDPEQNRTFGDHYLEVDYDLSKVLFIATANTTADIPVPLQDRMEIIRLSGYTDQEKLQIASRYLVPRSVKAAGLAVKKVRIAKGALEMIIRGYTREAGVRSLEREIQSVCRKLATKALEATERGEKGDATISVSAADVVQLLGPEKYRDTPPSKEREVGNVLGLAWTEVGGELLNVEVRTMPGRGQLILTGKLGDVMKESARTALSYIRAHADQLHVPADFHRKVDIHIHLPEGAIPKDGPSAGITLATALVSALSGIPARQDLAMTGEITLRGKVLKIGGLKEKALAAWRYRIRTILIPAENLSDIEEIPAEVRTKMKILPVSDFGEVLQFALGISPLEKPSAAATKASTPPPASSKAKRRLSFRNINP